MFLDLSLTFTFRQCLFRIHWFLLISWVWIPGFGFLGLDSWAWIPGFGVLGLDSWAWIPGFGALGLESWAWIPGFGLLAWTYCQKWLNLWFGARNCKSWLGTHVQPSTRWENSARKPVSFYKPFISWRAHCRTHYRGRVDWRRFLKIPLI